MGFFYARRTFAPAAQPRYIRDVKPSYEHFDHTADMGIRVVAETPEELFAPAAEGLYAAIGDLVSEGTPKLVKIDFPGGDPAALLRDFLAELLVIFERDRRFATTVDVAALTDSGLTVTLHTELIDFDRSMLLREVKAVTYHELAVRPIEGGYEATVIVDI